MEMKELNLSLKILYFIFLIICGFGLLASFVVFMGSLQYVNTPVNYYLIVIIGGVGIFLFSILTTWFAAALLTNKQIQWRGLVNGV